MEALVVDNHDLERLEDLLDPFDVFEAIGVASQEVRHSHFLAFLLNPSQNHGMGDSFTRRFLQTVLQSARTRSNVTPVELDLWDMSRIEVRREWQGIDVLLVDRTNEFVVLIENKVLSGEHGDQLSRYWKISEDYFPRWRRAAILLSPDAIAPSDDRYIPFGFKDLCLLIEALLERRRDSLLPDVRLLMTHYAQMLRRHFLESTEIAELARRIYQKHQRALDFIYEYRPDRQAQIRDVLVELTQSIPALEIDQVSKARLHFLPHRWDSLPELKAGIGWTDSGRVLLFEVANDPTQLSIQLTVGPGPEATRARLFEVAQTNKPPFNPSQSTLGRKWNMIHRRVVLTRAQLEGDDFEAVIEHLRQEWRQFVDQTLPELDARLEANGF